MIADQVKSLCHQMHLLGFLDAAERRVAESVANQLDPMEFLRLLLEDELMARRNQRGKALLNKAHFRSNAELEDWDSSYDRGINKAKIKELMGLSFYHNRQNLLILGGTGAGKTHLAVGIGRRACAETLPAAFVPMNYLFEEAVAHRAAGKYVSHIRKLSKVQVLMLDDFGLRNYTHDEATILVDILEERHQKGSVVITSQVNPEGWIKLFEDPVIAEAIIDRLKSPSQRIELKGPSYRDRLAKTQKIAKS